VTIRLSDVHFSYAAGTPWERKVLRGVSLKAGPGRCLGILGGNGSGKTTLVRHMNGLLLPQEGTVQVGDITLGQEMKRPPLLAGRVGLVFQFPEKQLFGETVLEDVALGLRFSGSAPEEAEGRAVEALRKVGVDPARYAARSPFSLNWGEKRKVAIAGVLALETPRVIFDEPGAGLDPAGRRHLLGLIRDLVDEGKTVVVVSHHLDDLFQVADDLAVLHDGKVVFRGSLEGLCRRESLRQWGLQWPPLIRTVKIAAGEKEDVKTAVRTPEEAAQVLRTLQRS
jgi:energy-coupling factor transport system ATP-binding protein